MPTKIKAVDEAGETITFDSIRAAGRAGFTVSRVHKAIYSGQRHKGLKWYLSGKLDALPAFMAATFDLDGKGWTHDQEIYAAFRLALAPDENLGDGQWDIWEFQQAVWRVVAPRPYTKEGSVRGLWKGERPATENATDRQLFDQRRGDGDSATPAESPKRLET